MPPARALAPFSVLLGIAVIVGCNTAGLEFRGGDDEVPCADFADAGVDAGFCDPAELGTRGPDGGGFPEADAAAACAALRTSSCGENDECLRDPGCVAADLLARFEPERCIEAVGDARSFPPCELGNCLLLVERVCGGGDGAIGACVDAPACEPAKELARRAQAGDASADASCAQALADEALFPPCG